MSLHIRDCSFRYPRGGQIFDGLNVSFDGGRTVLLGPNGAGKSTMLSLLASALDPKPGRVLLDGSGSPQVRAQRRGFRKRVAWLPQQVSVFPGLNVREHVAYVGWLKGLSRAEAWTKSKPALEIVDLGSSEGKAASKLSGGQLRRMGIAGALVHDAQVILLDEPTAGLDPAQRVRFREMLQRIPESKIVIVSTHQTEDISDSYQRVIVLNTGIIHFDGSVESFIEATPDSLDIRDRVVSAYANFVAAED